MADTNTRWFVQPQDDDTNERIVALIPNMPENVNPAPRCADGIERPLLELSEDNLKLVFSSMESKGLNFRPFRQTIGPKTQRGGKIQPVSLTYLKSIFNPQTAAWRLKALAQLRSKATGPF